MSGSNAELKGRGCAALINLIVSSVLLILLVALLLPGMIELPSWVYKVRDLTLADTRQIQRGAVAIKPQNAPNAAPNLLILNLRLQQGIIEHERLDDKNDLRLMLTYKSPEQYEPIWEKEVAQVAPSNLEDNLLIADQTRAYFLQNDKLQAYRLADGVKLWQTRLSDLVARNCHDCLQLSTAGVLVVLSKDQKLYGIDPSKGAIIWEKRLNSWHNTNIGFELAAQDIVLREEVIYPKQSGKANDSEMLLIDTRTGKNKQEILLPNTETITKIVEDKLYALSTGDSLGHLLCYALGSGDLLWENKLPKGYYFEANTPNWHFGEGKFYFVFQRKDEQSIWSFDPLGQSFHRLYQSQDYQFNLLELEQNCLYLQAHKLRGSRRYELWQISLNHQKRSNWQMPLQISQWNHLTETTFAYKILSNGQMLCIQRSDVEELLVRAIDLKNGEILQEKAYKVRPNPWTGTLWDKKEVYISLKGLYRLELETAKFSLNWP